MKNQLTTRAQTYSIKPMLGSMWMFLGNGFTQRLARLLKMRNQKYFFSYLITLPAKSQMNLKRNFLQSKDDVGMILKEMTDLWQLVYDGYAMFSINQFISSKGSGQARMRIQISRVLFLRNVDTYLTLDLRGTGSAVST